MKKWFVFASILTLALVAAACGGGNKGGEKTANYELENLGDATSEIVITAKNWEFDQPEYKIKSGETVNLSLKSIEGVHGVKIGDTKYAEIKNNKSVPVKFTAPGTYEIICSVPCGQGHATMKSKLIVE